MIQDPIIYQTTGGTDYDSYPIGSIIVSASQNVGEGWLRCDGSYINESEYPELVAYLGKNIPGVQDAFKGGSGSLHNGTFSTSYNYDGYTWVYWKEGESLLGFPVTGDPEIEIPVTGQFDFVWSTDAPVVLSICAGRVFLCQTAADLSYIYVYTGTFSTASAEIKMTKVNTESALAAAKDGNSYGLPNNLTQPSLYSTTVRNYKIYVPEVVYIKNLNIGSATKNYYVILALSLICGYKNNVNYAYYSTLYTSFLIPEDNVSDATQSLAYQTTPTYISYGYNKEREATNTLMRFSRKTADELIAITEIDYSSAFYAGLMSEYSGTYKTKVGEKFTNGNGETLSQYDTNDPVLVSPVANDEYYIYRAYIVDHEMYLRAGRVSSFTMFKDDGGNNPQKINGIRLSSYAQLFPDSLEYVSSHNMFVIFVGSGILFSHTPLDMDSWGYLDTTQYFGVITQWGNAEFNVTENTLCLSGRDSYGDYTVGLLKFHQFFDYSNDGAWLPYIASDGVPAWIKAKGEGNGTPGLPDGTKILKVTVADNISDCVTLKHDGMVLTSGVHTYSYQDGVGTFEVSLETIRKVSSSVAIQSIVDLHANGTVVASVNVVNDPVGTTKSVLLDVSQYIVGGIELKTTGG